MGVRSLACAYILRGSDDMDIFLYYLADCRRTSKSYRRSSVPGKCRCESAVFVGIWSLQERRRMLTDHPSPEHHVYSIRIPIKKKGEVHAQ